jgi:hypothetical protein
MGGMDDRINIAGVLKDPAGFHGAKEVHDVVRFGDVFKGLIGVYDSPGKFADRDKLPDHGIFILADHDPVARGLVDDIDDLARRVIANQELLKDDAFCGAYFDVAQAGFNMVRKYAEDRGEVSGIPISLERAGLVTTRLVGGHDKNAVIPEEVRVVTKRAHHKDEAATDLMVTVEWRDMADIARINDQVVEITDFVNPASGASALAMLVAARQRGGTPNTVIHRSFMATEQGIALARTVLRSRSMGGIHPLFYALGTSRELTPQYYLTNPAVADAGDVLCRYLPDWYQE